MASTAEFRAESSVEQLLDALRAVPVASSDADRISQIEMLERVKAVAAAVQARVGAAFASSQRAVLSGSGVSAGEAARSIGSQIALARRESPSRGSRHLGFAEALTSDMPGTLAALERGETSEWRATLVVRETAILSRADRQAVDAELAPRLASLGDRATEQAARRIGLRLDADAAWRRAHQAASGRRVSIRTLPDALVALTNILPVAEGVACYAELCREADLGRTPAASNTPSAEQPGARSGGAGQSGSGRRVPRVQVQLVMTDRTLLDGDPEPAEILGYGPIPAGLARSIITRALDAATFDAQGADPATAVFVRRLFTDEAGRLVAAESRRRCFPPGVADFIRIRDGGICRTPGCGAPIRHLDHITPATNGGRTSTANGAGLCERCNYTKQSPGWRSTAQPDGSIEITTPTGHLYMSRPPPLPGVA